jgi:hypothetical protein
VATFAVINNGIVENCLVADSLAIAEEITGYTCVEYTPDVEVSIGYLYENGVFTNPNPTIPLPPAPTNGKLHTWDEETQTWVEVSIEE